MSKARQRKESAIALGYADARNHPDANRPFWRNPYYVIGWNRQRAEAAIAKAKRDEANNIIAKVRQLFRNLTKE